MRSFLRMALKDRGENPFRIGWESAKANAVPMVVLWLFAVGLVVGYYFVPGVAEVLKPIAKWQVRWGIRAAIVNQLVFGVLVPAVFVMAERKIRMRRPLLKLACQSGWSVMYAVIFVWFYGLQAAMFGKDNDFTTLTLRRHSISSCGRHSCGCRSVRSSTFGWGMISPLRRPWSVAVQVLSVGC